MTTEERIQFADKVWVACHGQLTEPLREQLMVMKKAAHAFDKNTKGSARLRVKPNGKVATPLWDSGNRWYEVHVGGIKGVALAGSVFFLYSAHRNEGAPTPFSIGVRQVLQEAALELRSIFVFSPGEDAAQMTLAVNYKDFPNVDEWARDLARLVEATFPRLQALTA